MREIIPVSVIRFNTKEDEEVKMIFQYGVPLITGDFARVKAEIKLAGPIPKNKFFGSFITSSNICQPNWKGRMIGF